MKRQNTWGYTLAEILVVVAITACLAAVAIPSLRALEPTRLDVAAEEVANALRYAINEASRTQAYVLVDGETVPGHLRVVASDATGADLGAVTDPLTKRPLDIDVAACSPGAAMTPQFFQGGVPYGQLLVGPGANLQADDGASVVGALAPGSGIVLTLDTARVTVAVNELTGRVTVQ